jgi:hypothetical protein
MVFSQPKDRPAASTALGPWGGFLNISRWAKKISFSAAGLVLTSTITKEHTKVGLLLTKESWNPRLIGNYQKCGRTMVIIGEVTVVPVLLSV